MWQIHGISISCCCSTSTKCLGQYNAEQATHTGTNSVQWWANPIENLLNVTDRPIGHLCCWFKKCIGGPTCNVYKACSGKNNQQYGQAFVFQRAFREKLSNLSKVQTKDPKGTLQTPWMVAMPYVKGLEILNDSEKNQKLPVTNALIEVESFPVSVP